MIDGYKMGGNAQRYIRHVLLQHGSIPLSLDRKLLKPFFLEESGLEDAASLRKLKIIMDVNELKKRLRETFCETFDVNIKSDKLSLNEEKYAKKLLEEKYIKEEWNLYGNNMTI